MWGAIKAAINSMVGKGVKTLDKVSMDSAEGVIYEIMRDKHGTTYHEGDYTAVCPRASAPPASWITGSTTLKNVYFSPETKYFITNILIGCSEIEELYIPSAVEISYGAFSNLPFLKTVVLGNNLTNLGPNAFYECPELKFIFFRGTLLQWELVKKDSNWKTGEVTVYCYDGTTKA